MTATYFTLGNQAQGAIGPVSGDAMVDTILDAVVTDDFYLLTATALPARCIDGRSPAEGFANALPNAAGGSESLLVAQLLTGVMHGATVEAFDGLLGHLQQQSLATGGHTDTGAEGRDSGCGANDKLPFIMEFIAQHGDAVRSMAAQLGVEVSDDVFRSFVAAASTKHEYSNGAELLHVLRQRGASVDVLDGTHKEVAVVINTVPGTTLNRAAITERFGGDYQVFNVDVWAFEAAARSLSEDDETIDTLVAAMVFYNIATAFVLGSPQLRVVVRGE